MNDLRSHLSLLTVPGLESLAKTCEELAVTLTAHGGFVRRVAQAVLLDPSRTRLPDVFSLTRFGADIDLVHSGPRELNAAVQRSIYSHVAGGESLRWEVRSEEEDFEFRRSKQVADVVPANLLRLSSRAGSWFEDPWDGLDDIVHEAYRFLRNGYYRTSPLFLVGRDLEVFAALRYVLALADADLWQPKDGRSQLSAQPGYAAALDVIGEALERPTIIRLQQSAYLRACLRHLVRKLGVTVPRSARRTSLAGRLEQFLAEIEDEVPALKGVRAVFSPQHSETVIASQRLGGDTYRLDELTQDWMGSCEASEALGRALLSLPSPARGGDLAPGQRVLLASTPLPVNAGTAFAESSLGEPEDTAHELVELAVPLHPIPDSDDGSLAVGEHGDEDLAMVFSLFDVDQEQTVAFFPSLSTCRFEHRESPAREDGLLTVRGSCFKVLERATEIAETLLQRPTTPHLQVWILGCAGRNQ